MAFQKKYLSFSPGFYTSGDAGFFDEEGYLHVMTRLDDVINVAAHRLSTYQMEEVLIQHNEVVEAAVVSNTDDLKGEVPIGLVVLGMDSKIDHKQLEKELVQLIRNDIGPIACFKQCMVVDKLPKTKSGKVLRHVLKAMIRGTEVKVPPTIEDVDVLKPILKVVLDRGFGKKVEDKEKDGEQQNMKEKGKNYA